MEASRGTDGPIKVVKPKASVPGLNQGMSMRKKTDTPRMVIRGPQTMGNNPPASPLGSKSPVGVSGCRWKSVRFHHGLGSLLGSVAFQF